MDIHDVRGVMVAVMLLTFIGLVVWAWSRRNTARFDAAANLPFADDQKDDNP